MSTNLDRQTIKELNERGNKGESIVDIRRGIHQLTQPPLLPCSLGALKPFQLVFNDGIERLAADSIRERAQWVAAAREALNPLPPRKDTHRRSSTDVGPIRKDSQLERINTVWNGSHKDGTGTTPSGLRLSQTPPSKAQTITAHLMTSPVRPAPELTQPLQSPRSVQPSMTALAVPQTPPRWRGSSCSRIGTEDGDVTVRYPSGSVVTFGGEHELFPSDSASQIPPRNYADERIELPQELASLKLPDFSPSQMQPEVQRAFDANIPAPLPMRDLGIPEPDVWPPVAETPKAQDTPREHSSVASPADDRRLGTVIEETSSQAQGSKAASRRSEKKTATSPPPKTQRSMTASNSQRSEVSKVLEYLEQEWTNRQARDQELVGQLASLKESIAVATLGNIAPRAQKSTEPLASRSAATDASLQQLQQKMDRVIELVTVVSSRKCRQGSEVQSPGCASAKQELQRIGSAVDELLQRVRSTQATSKPASLAGSRVSHRSQTEADKRLPGTPSELAREAKPASVLSGPKTPGSKVESHPSQGRGTAAEYYREAAQLPQQDSPQPQIVAPTAVRPGDDRASIRSEERDKLASPPPASVVGQSTKCKDMAELHAALKENEEARKFQQAQQADIARYLNSLNAWLEKDIQSRSQDFKTLAENVSKLSKDVAGLQSSRSGSKQDTGEPVTSREAPPHPDGVQPRAAEDSTPRAATVEDAADEQAKIEVLQAAQEELSQHRSVEEKKGRVVSANDGSKPLSEATASALGEAARKKDSGGIRSIIKEAAAAGAGGTAVKALMDHFEREEDKEDIREDGEDQLPKPGGATQQEGAPAIADRAVHSEGPLETAGHAFDAINAIKKGDIGAAMEALAALKHKTGGQEAAEPREPPPPQPAPSRPHVIDALKALKGGNVLDALRALKHGHLSEALASAGAGEAGPDDAAPPADDHPHLHALKDEAIGAVGGAVLATAVEELLHQFKEKHEEDKLARAEAAKKEAEAEVARLEAEKRHTTTLEELQMKQGQAIVGAIAELLSTEKQRQEQVEQQRRAELDPKTAIEALVKTLNEVRLGETQERLATNEAIAQLATGVVQAMGKQHEALLMTLASMSRDWVKTGIDEHLNLFRGAMATSFAGSAQAMADAWMSHAKSVGAGSGPKAIEAPKPAPAAAPAKAEGKPAEKPAAAPAPAAPAPAKPKPPPLGPYGVPPRAKK